MTATLDDEESECLGTREITIRTRSSATVGQESEELRPALLIGYQVKAELELYISDGSIHHYYQGRISPRDTKVVYPSNDDSCDDDRKVKVLAKYVLEEMDGVSLNVEGLLSGENVKFAIRQRLETGIVKLIWSGLIPRVPSNSTSSFTFVKLLGWTIQCGLDKCKMLQEKCNVTQSNLEGWKDSAEKLSKETWQAEKDSILQNFLILYRKTHEKLCQTQLELQQLEDRHNATVSGTQTHTGQSRTQTTSSTSKSTQRRQATRSAARNDFDELLYDPSTIDRLAAGPQIVNEDVTVDHLMGTTASAKLPRTREAKMNTNSPPAFGTHHVQSSTNDTTLVAPRKHAPSQSQMKEPCEEMGIVKTISSAKELFEDLAAAKRQKRSCVPSNHGQPLLPNNAKETEGTNAPPPEKKTKVSHAVNAKRRKELEQMAAILAEDDDSE